MQQVLVVDDDGIYRTIMMRVLTRAGFSVSGVQGGAEALDHLDTVRPASS
jgi:CheY-like chemotaxis protein